MYGIAADAQHLGIILLEPAVSLPEESCLAGSTRGEIKDVEGKDHRLFTSILAEGYFPVLWGGKLEIWGYVANICRHVHTPLDYGDRPGRRLRDYNPPLTVRLSPRPFNLKQSISRAG